VPERDHAHEILVLNQRNGALEKRIQELEDINDDNKYEIERLKIEIAKQQNEKDAHERENQKMKSRNFKK
jgi:uncharacterized small protein (DUF1192 family)